MSYTFVSFWGEKKRRRPKAPLCDIVHILWLGVVSFVLYWNAKDSVTSIFEASELLKKVVHEPDFAQGSTISTRFAQRFVNIYNIAVVLLSLCLLFCWKLVKICIQWKKREKKNISLWENTVYTLVLVSEFEMFENFVVHQHSINISCYD